MSVAQRQPLFPDFPGVSFRNGISAVDHVDMAAGGGADRQNTRTAPRGRSANTRADVLARGAPVAVLDVQPFGNQYWTGEQSYRHTTTLASVVAQYDVEGQLQRRLRDTPAGFRQEISLVDPVTGGAAGRQNTPTVPQGGGPPTLSQACWQGEAADD